MRAGNLVPHERNWRRHPPAQRRHLQAILQEVGFAGAVLAREVDGRLQLIDGHLRAEMLPEEQVPVIVLDVDEREDFCCWTQVISHPSKCLNLCKGGRKEGNKRNRCG